MGARASGGTSGVLVPGSSAFQDTLATLRQELSDNHRAALEGCLATFRRLLTAVESFLAKIPEIQAFAEERRRLEFQADPQQRTRWEACLVHVNEFYARWRQLLSEISGQAELLRMVLPQHEADTFLTHLYPNDVTSSVGALRWVVQRLEEFAASGPATSSPQETPAERKRRVDAFCHKHNCTKSDICKAAKVHRSDFYKWQASKKHGPSSEISRRIEAVLAGRRPLSFSGRGSAEG